MDNARWIGSPVTVFWFVSAVDLCSRDSCGRTDAAPVLNFPTQQSFTNCMAKYVTFLFTIADYHCLVERFN